MDYDDELTYLIKHRDYCNNTDGHRFPPVLQDRIDVLEGNSEPNKVESRLSWFQKLYKLFKK